MRMRGLAQGHGDFESRDAVAVMLSRVAIARRVRTVDGDGVEGGLIEFPWYPPTCRKVLWASHPRLLDYRVPLLDDLRESRATTPRLSR